MKLTYKEINYILGIRHERKNFDWMTEGVLEEADSGYGYYLTIYIKKPVYYIIRPLLTIPVFVYLILEEGVKEAKEDFERTIGRKIVCFHLHINESTKEEYERAKVVEWLKGE